MEALSGLSYQLFQPMIMLTTSMEMFMYDDVGHLDNILRYWNNDVHNVNRVYGDVHFDAETRLSWKNNTLDTMMLKRDADGI